MELMTNKMTTKRALELGLPIKQSKRFLRTKRSILAVLKDREKFAVLEKVKRIVERSQFEVNFQYFNDVYVLSSDGSRYINFDILLNKNFGIGLIDYKDFLSKIMSIETLSEREKISAICKFEQICSYIGDCEILNVCYAVLHSLSVDLRESRSEKALFLSFIKENKFDLNFIDPPKKEASHQPDAWVLIDGEECPVEAKKGEFNAKALKQLLRYMKVFGASKGVAVAKSLKTPLPENVVFYNIQGELA